MRLAEIQGGSRQRREQRRARKVSPSRSRSERAADAERPRERDRHPQHAGRDVERGTHAAQERENEKIEQHDAREKSASSRRGGEPPCDEARGRSRPSTRGGTAAARSIMRPPPWSRRRGEGARAAPDALFADHPRPSRSEARGSILPRSSTSARSTIAAMAGRSCDTRTIAAPRAFSSRKHGARARARLGDRARVNGSKPRSSKVGVRARARRATEKLLQHATRVGSRRTVGGGARARPVGAMYRRAHRCRARRRGCRRSAGSRARSGRHSRGSRARRDRCSAATRRLRCGLASAPRHVGAARAWRARAGASTSPRRSPRATPRPRPMRA